MRKAVAVGALSASMGAFLCFGSAIAGSMSATPISIDKATAPEVITLPAITVTFGNTLTYQDELSISLAGAAPSLADGYPLPVTCNLTYPAPYPAIGFLSTGADRWSFRITTQSGIVAGDTCTFSSLKIARASIGETCQLTASYAAKMYGSSTIIDSAGPATVANVTPCGPPPPQVIEVSIDIKPGDLPNSINTSSRGSIPVAILSSSTFYAPGDVDLSFPLMFGGMSMQPSLIKCNAAGEDVNHDGYVDLVCHFATQMTGFVAGDSVGFLFGRTKHGAYVIGQDSVRILK